MTTEEIIDIAKMKIAEMQSFLVHIIEYMYKDEELQSYYDSGFLMREIGEAISDNYEAKKMDDYNNSRHEIEMNNYLPSVVKGVRTIEGLHRLVKALKED